MRYPVKVENNIGSRVRNQLATVASDSTQAQIASEVGMTPDAFSRALRGQRQFAAIELAKLAERLKVSMHWLATGQEDPNRVLVAARHSFDHTTRQHESVDWSVERYGLETVASAYVHAFGSNSVQPLPPLPSAPGEARQRLREAAGGDFVFNFAQAVEEAFGIEVIRVPELTRSYSLSVAGHRIVVVKPHPNWFFQNWSIAHELGHFATGELNDLVDVSTDSSQAEIDANAFAAELLLPAAGLRAIDWQDHSPAELAENLWSWGISTEALRRRLASLQIVPSEGVRELLGLPTQRVIHHYRMAQADGFDDIADRMERASTRRFPVGLLAAHTSAVAEGSLGVEYLAWMLDAEPGDLESEFGPPTGTPDFDELASALGLQSNLS